MRGGGRDFWGAWDFFRSVRICAARDIKHSRGLTHSSLPLLIHKIPLLFTITFSTCSLCQALATPSPTARLSTCSRPSCLNLAVSLLVSCVLPRLGASLHLSLLRSTLVPRRPIITPLLARCTIDHTARPGCPASAHRRTHVRFVVARSLLFAALLLLVLLRVRLVRGIFVGIEDKVRASALLLAVL